MILVEAQIHDAMGLLLIMAILFMFFGFLSKPLFRFGRSSHVNDSSNRSNPTGSDIIMATTIDDTEWHKVEPHYEWFQVERYVNEKHAVSLVVETESGPFKGGLKYQITLLDGVAPDSSPEIIDDGYESADDASHEAEALIITDAISDHL